MGRASSPLAAVAALAALVVACACKPEGGAAAGLPAVQERGALRIAMTGMYPPFNFFDTTGALQGFDVDVSREVSRRLGVEADLVTLRWDGIIPGLLAGRYDAIIGSMAITPERQKSVDFTRPYYVSGAQAFAKKDSPRAARADLEGAIVGVTLGTTYEAAVRRQPGVKEVRTYAGIPEILADLQVGRIDAFVTDKLVGLHATREGGVEVVPIGAPLYEERIGIAVKKGQADLVARIDQAVAAMREDGTSSKLAKKWFGRDVFAAGQGG